MGDMRFISVNDRSILTSLTDEEIAKAKIEILHILQGTKKLSGDLIDSLCDAVTEWCWELSPHFIALSLLVEKKEVEWFRDEDGYVWYFLPEELKA